MKVILDANVLIAALAGRGLCEALLELCLEEHDVFISEEILAEVHRNLIKRIRVPEEVAKGFCSLLQTNATLCLADAVSADACRDPDDLHLLGLAQSAGVDFLITGDKDLLECRWPGTAQIVTPRQFWERCRQR
jgi:putative PIN family toxin of toxin-antitoxin system